MNSDQKKELKKVAGELKNASKMHASQSERISKLVDAADKSLDEVDEIDEGNCGCGQDPCKTYGTRIEINEEDMQGMSIGLLGDGKFVVIDQYGEALRILPTREEAMDFIRKHNMQKEQRDTKQKIYESRDNKLYNKLLKKWTK